MGTSWLARPPLLVPSPEDDTPWIGLLLMTGRHQGEGLGREALGALEDRLAGDGWRQLKLPVMQDNPRVQQFWMRAGYRALREDVNHAGRAVLVMEKDLTGSSPVASASAVWAVPGPWAWKRQSGILARTGSAA